MTNQQTQDNTLEVELVRITHRGLCSREFRSNTGDHS